ELSSSEDLITIPLFFDGDPLAFNGFISIASYAGRPRYSGSLNKNTPDILVGLRSQSLPSPRN
ncbi:MAG TPA: hypothetical protein VEX17_00430, partial [Bacillales bacterium]|nr:hypothetical protein [Bacillales bacterium]